MAEEQLILVSEANRAVGAAGKTAVHRRGLLHRAFSIFIVDGRGRMLLQQRHRHKYHSGGLWANSCCGHPHPGERTFICALEGPAERTWLAIDIDGGPITDRGRLRAAISIAALCEVAEEQAGGGELEELRGRLVSLRLTESPPGIEEAESAALALESAIGAPPRVASPAYLDAVAAATRRLEAALGSEGESPFTVALQQAVGAVEELTREIESAYKLPLT